MRERDLFIEALQKTDPADRIAYLDAACAGDEVLRGRVLQLLVQHEKNESFLLDAPAPLPQVPPNDTIDQPTIESPNTFIGPYKLVEQIGEGGMGTVWMAQQTEPVKRLVAVKLIKAGMDSKQVIARFEAERQALALMDHPNIARVLDGGTTGAGRPYFVMDLVKGVPITRYCDEHHLTPRQRLELFLPICQAIQHAHQKGIIHRDLKPSNVLVALYDGRPVPKVIDFGVAKAAGQSLTDKTLVTGFGNIVGTLEYMSPEQAEINQLDIDTRSDIYSLGVLLYELLAGSPPFSRKELEKSGMLEMLRVIREQEPSKPSTKLSSSDALPTLSANRGTEPAKLTKLVRGELDWIVMKALEKDRNRRYETANGFAMDVQRYLSDEAVQACPPSAAYRLRKFARRNKSGLAVAAMVLFFLLLFGSGVGWALRDRSAREAEAARQQGQRQAKAAGQVESIFAEVDRLEAEQQWPEALAAARRAGAVVAGGEADAETTERVHARLKELEFIDRLEHARMQAATWVGQSFDYAAADREYARLFREYGVNVDEVPVETAVERLKARPPLGIPVAAALDDWAQVHWSSRRDGAASKRLVAVARGIDPNPVRDRLRATWGRPASEVGDEHRRLAESIDVRAEHPVALGILAGRLGRMKQPDHAVRLLRDAQRAHPGDFWLNFKLASQLQEQEDYEGAVRFYTAAVTSRPHSDTACNNLGVALWRQGKLDEAIAAFRKAIELDPKFANAYVGLGALLGDELKEYEKAVDCFRKAIELDPKSAPAHNNLGAALSHQKKLREAVAAYRKAIELDPKSAAAHSNLGMALSDQNKLDEAIAVILKAIELDPKSAPAYTNLGVALKAQGKLDEAIAAYRKAIELDPKLASAHNGLGYALGDQKKLGEAIAAFRTAIELDPKLANAFNNLGNALRDQKKLDEAIAAYRKAIELDPKSAPAYTNLGVALQAQGKLDEAIAAYRKAIELDPNHARGFFSLGAALAEQKKWDESIAAYRKAIELDPKFANAFNNLGNALFHQRKLDEAVDAYRKALEIDPNDANARVCLTVALCKKALQFRDMKNAAGCLAVAAECETLKLTDDESMYNAACIQALCASAFQEDPKTPAADAARLAKEQADLAMAWLHKAVAAGYKDVANMRQDKDLDALRDREDFKKLLAELEDKRK